MSDNRQCSIEACNKPSFRRGLCSAHYYRLLRHGDPLAGGTSHGEPLAFFENVVLPYDGDDCLIWPFTRTTNGYARLWHEGRLQLVSRLVCEHVHGPPPTPKHEAAHWRCGKGHEGCVTGRHVRWATPTENEADKIIHGTDSRGERCGTSKLTEDDVRAIRELPSAQREIAAKFGVSERTIRHIKSGETWRHIGISPIASAHG